MFQHWKNSTAREQTRLYEQKRHINCARSCFQMFFWTFQIIFLKKHLFFFTYTNITNTDTKNGFLILKVYRMNLTLVKFPLHQNVHRAQPHQGQRRFLNNLGLKQLHITSINSLRIQPWKQVTTLIYNPEKGLPHPLTPSLLNRHPHK